MQNAASPIALLLGLSLLSFGCAGTDTEASSGVPGTGGNGGAGGATGGGGAGGKDCVSEDEVCDGVDNDCDEEVDEGCECQPDDTQPCYSGPPETKGKGACKGGTQTCPASGHWGDAQCAGQVKPVAEKCNGIDDDCNGAPDDGLGQKMCGIGACLATVDACIEGRPGVCVPGQPTLEICDGIDNNCDQVVDESFPGAGEDCDTGAPGVCAAGTMQCDGAAPVCVQSALATGEICDSQDNDCDGMVDDNIPGTGGACSTGLQGICSAGTVSCQNGSIDCFPDTPPSAELCDGVDNDCNGTADEGDPGSGGACLTGLPGSCVSGTKHCVNGAIKCVPNNAGQPEVCDNVDNNCNGMTDENNPGGGIGCGCGGTLNCVSGSLQCQGGPVIYFEETFANNAKGWTLGPEWAIGPAVGGPAGACADPDTDHTPTADNGIAGVTIGGCYATVYHTAYYYLMSPIINTAAAPAVFLQYWRFLKSEYAPYMTNVVEVFNGATWTVIWQSGVSPGVNDTQWTKQSFDITAYKNANMRIRFGFNVGQMSGVDPFAGWNLDDVLLTAAACP